MPKQDPPISDKTLNIERSGDPGNKCDEDATHNYINLPDGTSQEIEYGPRQKMWKGVVSNVDLRWRALFILVTFVNLVAAIVVVITATSLDHAVQLNRETTCQNFHASHPTLPTNPNCERFVRP